MGPAAQSLHMELSYMHQIIDSLMELVAPDVVRVIPPGVQGGWWQVEMQPTEGTHTVFFGTGETFAEAVKNGRSHVAAAR